MNRTWKLYGNYIIIMFSWTMWNLEGVSDTHKLFQKKGANITCNLTDVKCTDASPWMCCIEHTFNSMSCLRWYPWNPLKLTVRISKMVVGRRSFPFGAPPFFEVRTVCFRDKWPKKNTCEVMMITRCISNNPSLATVQTKHQPVATLFLDHFTQGIIAIPTAHLLRTSLTNHKPVYLDLLKVLGKKHIPPMVANNGDDLPW